MLTARTDEVDRVVGLELGADDYLGKPFSVLMPITTTTRYEANSFASARDNSCKSSR